MIHMPATLTANVKVEFVSRVEMAVQLLIDKNIKHRKTGIHTAEATWIDIIPHLVSEIRELNYALADCKKDEWKCPQVEEELADVYGILVHAILKAGYSMEQIELRCLRKFEERFDNVQLIQNGVGGAVPHLAFVHGSTDLETDTSLEKKGGENIEGTKEA
jgi:NTP pyrophosphatase (non-canonical NTP hydrolase)